MKTEKKNKMVRLSFTDEEYSEIKELAGGDNSHLGAQYIRGAIHVTKTLDKDVIQGLCCYFGSLVSSVPYYSPEEHEVAKFQMAHEMMDAIQTLNDVAKKFRYEDKQEK